jgi:mannose-6-phosphate isomerase-like protein (cupin superfamily)
VYDWTPNPWSYQWNPYYAHWNPSRYPHDRRINLTDHGNSPFVVNIEQAAKQNQTYRTAIWTGKHLQVTVMSINVGDDIGLEVHPTTDQFIRIEEGQGLVQMGPSRDRLDFQQMAYEDDAIMIPAGTWHNVVNTGHKPLKVYVIYAPPEHPFGTVHETKQIAMAAEESGHDR